MHYFSPKFEIVYELSPQQIQDLHRLYQTTWWADNRDLPGVEAMLKHTDLIIGLSEVESHKLIAFVRVLTDYIYRAVLWDVIVDETYQGQGLGKQLLEIVFNHPQLQGVETILLVCTPDVANFYNKLGFHSHEDKLIVMSHSSYFQRQQNDS